MGRTSSRLNNFFEISARGSTVATELRGGVVPFNAMAYIIVLNPIIRSGSPDVAGNELGFTQVSAVTSLAASVVGSPSPRAPAAGSFRYRHWAAHHSQFLICR